MLSSPFLATGKLNWRLLIASTVVLACVALAWAAPPAAAHASSARPARPGATFKNAVTFIGDSVTAGFGYCGVAENAPGVSCSVNQQMSDSWNVYDTNLERCFPPSSPAPLNDACSNNNNNGSPWNSPPWRSSPNSPDIAYPFQIAASQSLTGAAAVSDWAVSGSTPANWDPAGGVYGPQLKKLTDQYVVMTLGGNPLLGDFIQVTFGFSPIISGSCVSSTGYEVGYFYRTWYSGPLSNPVGCLDRRWTAASQTRHLVSVYEALLSQGDRVLVLGYYRSCPWSFGNWQTASLYGPSDGLSCSSQSRPVSPSDSTQVTQWQQAVVVGNTLDTLIRHAVTVAQTWAKDHWPGTDRYRDLAWAKPNEGQWAQHQPLSPSGSWIQLNDTWIHPDQAGHAQLAKTVTASMCVNFRHWCGSPPVWG